MLSTALDAEMRVEVVEMSRPTHRLIATVVLVTLTGAAVVTVLIGSPSWVISRGEQQDDAAALPAPSGVTQPGLPRGQSAESSPTEEVENLQSIPNPTPALEEPILTPVVADVGGIGAQPTPKMTPVPKKPSLVPLASVPPTSATMVDGNLTIPRIGVSAEIVPVGITEEGNMATPPSPWKVGWYKFGAIPGELGKVVLAGHLDSQDGPAIFWNLNQLQPGDRIEVTSGGRTYTYVVTSSAIYPFNDAPVDEIFGSNNRPELVLITCDGTFDHGTHNYDQRLVVYTELATDSSQAGD